MHRIDKHSPWPVQSPEGCLSFSQSWRMSYNGSVNLGSTTFCFGSGGTSLVTAGGFVAYSTTIHVSLPSFVRVLEMADLVGVEVLEDLLDLSLEFCCFCGGLLAVDCC